MGIVRAIGHRMGPNDIRFADAGGRPPVLWDTDGRGRVSTVEQSMTLTIFAIGLGVFGTILAYGCIILSLFVEPRVTYYG